MNTISLAAMTVYMMKLLLFVVLLVTKEPGFIVLHGRIFSIIIIFYSIIKKDKFNNFKNSDVFRNSDNL